MSHQKAVAHLSHRMWLFINLYDLGSPTLITLSDEDSMTN